MKTRINNNSELIGKKLEMDRNQVSQQVISLTKDLTVITTICIICNLKYINLIFIPHKQIKINKIILAFSFYQGIENREYVFI